MSVIAKNTGSHVELRTSVGSDELSSLVEREQRIERAQRNAYLEIGLDLMAIRDKQLYKTERMQAIAGRYSFTTFEEYVETRWDITPQYANGVIRSAEAVQKMETIVSVLPSKESHVRELLKIEGDDDRATVWQSVVDRDETVTAKVVAEEVQRFISQKTKNWFTVPEWEAITEDERSRLFLMKSDAQFNKQDNSSIEWAQWSWNPITGCKHDCPYCYARDIAKRFYAQGFEPSIYPSRMVAPINTKVPDKSAHDTAFKNVFTGSMSDIFGRWVPDEWINKILEQVRDNPQWNFLFLTKFPQRIHEFGQMPDNAWMGTSVDCQERVASAEKAFSKMGGGIKWLSVEPMLTPLKFKKLDLFDWVVIGGASKSSHTPAWIPPFDWVADLHQQARAAGCAIYQKVNLFFDSGKNYEDGDLVKLGNRLMEFPWSETSNTACLPDTLKYLSMK